VKNLFPIIVFTLSVTCFSQNVTVEDLEMAIGNWEGSITYIDYQSNKPFTMPANLRVEQGKNAYTLLLNNSYPNEPKANSSDKIKISKDGSFLNKHQVTTRTKSKNNGVELQTEHESKDAGKKALIRYTYRIGPEIFMIRKEVQFKAQNNWLKRSEYSYTRK